MSMKLCPCQSGKSFSLCCEPLLQGQRFAKTPVQLMRSRYSAFALGAHGDYLLATWATEQSGELTAANLSQRSTDWQGLEIVSKAQQGEQAWVEFKAFYSESLNAEQGAEQSEKSTKMTHHERSTFVRRQGRWFYLKGEIF